LTDHRKQRAIVLLSGGIDSTVCINLLINKKFHVSSIFIDYGQAANKYEEESSINISRFYDIPHNIIRINSDVSFGKGEIFGRNAFLILTGLMYFSSQCDLLSIGIHSGSPYYDCSSSFFDKLTDIIDESSNGKIAIIAPLISWTKEDIIIYATENKLPIHLTYSCENGTYPPCNKCLSCIDRRIISASSKA